MRKVTLNLFERTRWIYGTHTDKELWVIKNGGDEMRNESKAANLHSKKISTMSERQTQRIGVAGEHALCKAVQIPFELRINIFKRFADVGTCIDVRTARKHTSEQWPEFPVGRTGDVLQGRLWAFIWMSPCMRAFIFAGTILGDHIPDLCKRGRLKADGEETWLVPHRILDSPMYLFYDLHPELEPEPETDWSRKYSDPERFIPPKMLPIPTWPAAL